MTEYMLSISNLLNVGDEIVSQRTGNVLKCYNKMNVHLGERIIDVEYSMWNAEKRKCKSYKSKDLKQMLDGVWKLKQSTLKA